MELWCIFALIFALILNNEDKYNIHYNTVLENNIQPDKIAHQEKLIPRKIFHLTADKNNINDAFKKNTSRTNMFNKIIIKF